MTADGSHASKKLVRVVLIHNNEPSRLKTSRVAAAAVAESMALLGNVQTTEISVQPAFRPQLVSRLAIRHLDQWWLERRWASYLGVSRRWFLSLGLLSLRLLQLTSPRVRRTRGRRANIELCLSAKHELAWRQAYEDNVDLLIVLEDDVVLHPESATELRAIVDDLACTDLEDTYLDFAGGLTMSELRINHLARPRRSGLLELEKPATNTSCAYLLGNGVLADLAAATILRPNLTRFPADWVLNHHFLENERQVTCLHSDPPALQHGSRTGAVASSIA